MTPRNDDERTPLLGPARGCCGIETLDDTPQPRPTPLPKLQLGILCFMRVLDPITFSQIFPYVNQFITDVKVTNDPSRVGYYSGLVESMFAATQILAIYPWGLLSDTFGRRPMVLVGLAGVTASTSLFGLSQSFPQMLLARALAGLFSGNVAIIPAMLCDITDKTNQAIAFPFFCLWWPLGGILGPLIGGSFANPASKWPQYFGGRLFTSFPYLLPCLVVSTISYTGFIAGYFLLKETLRKGEVNALLQEVASGEEESDDKNHRYTAGQLLSLPIIRALCNSASALSFVSTAFDVMFVLFCYSPLDNGGLAFSTSQIGTSLALGSLYAMLLQLLAMPRLLKRYDHGVLYNFCMRFWVPTFLSLPLLRLVVCSNWTERTTCWLLWCGIAIVLAISKVACLPFSINMILVKRFAPNPASLGSTTAMVQFAICVARALSATFAGVAFAFSIECKFLFGCSWVLAMAVVSFGSSLLSQKVASEARHIS